MYVFLKRWQYKVRYSIGCRFSFFIFVIALGILYSATEIQAGFQLPGGTLFSRNGYDYAVSMYQEGNVQNFWWCGYGNVPGTTVSTDVVFYRRYNFDTGQWSDIQTVLWPTWGTGKWDSYFTCDPSVIRGEFINPENGNAYSHAMYYTATDRSDGTNNKIGLAFSNDGITWERLSRPVIAPQVNPTSGYGAGQAATYNINAKAGIYVFYTDTSTNLGSRVWVRYTSNGIAFGPPVLLSNQGVPLSYNSDFAYDYNSGYFYAAISLLPRPVDRETYRFVIARMPANDLLNGHGVWEALATVDTGVTGYYLNHSPGLLRDYYGNLTPWLPAIEVYFSEGTNDPATWDLTWVIWSP